ncbi:DUF4349 domain-containing protein [Saccharopolyspora sp. CA-218241]|uniref:DUF4349 domain-containing protein n=1 Tax=Saccharopolyspora sp. CA-218241 TaxID=3240027 RepID=UPI003D99E0D0
MGAGRVAGLVLAGALLVGCSSGGVVDTVGRAGSAPAEVASAEVVDAERRVVRSAELELAVDDPAGTAGAVRRAGERSGGHLARERGDADRVRLSLRVPAERLDAVLAELSGLGRVLSRSTSTEDVTEQVVDTGSRLESQRASVRRLRELLDRATTVAEVVQVEAELTERETELEALERRRAALADRVAMAEVDVVLERSAARGAGFLAGVTTGLHSLGGAGSLLLTWLGVALPYVVLLALPAAAGVLLVRRRRRARTPPLG